MKRDECFCFKDGQLLVLIPSNKLRIFTVGQLLPTDFALYEGESEWKTVGALLEYPNNQWLLDCSASGSGTAETRVAQIKFHPVQIRGPR